MTATLAHLTNATELDDRYPNRRVLRAQRDPMIDYLTRETDVGHAYAEAAVDHLWDRLVRHLVTRDAALRPKLSAKIETFTEADVPRYAERIVDQTLALVVALGRNPGVTLGPSTLIDVGWHVWLLYTLERRAFEVTAFGHQLEHMPADVPGVEPITGGLDPYQLRDVTVAAIEAESDLVVDHELWSYVNGANWNSCNSLGRG